MLISLFLAYVAVCGIMPAQTEGQTYGLLKNERSKITFIPYTPQQRETVANYSRILLSWFVNRDVKIKKYSHDYPDFDPIPRIEKLVEKAASMTDRDFQYNLSSLFLSLRDDHATYAFPGPHKCFAVSTGLSFDLVEGGTLSNPVVVVKTVTTDSQTLSFSPGLKNVSIGDQLRSVDGKTFAEFTNENRFLNGGTNLYSSQRHALQDLAVYEGEKRRMPVNDSVKFVFKKRLTNKTYELDLPWIAIRLDECYAASAKVIETITGKPLPAGPVQTAPALVNATQTEKIEAVDSKETKVGNSSQPLPTRPINLKKTDSDVLSWDIFRPTSENVGILRLDGFPQYLPPQFLVSVMRSLLVNQLRNTKGLVIDIRGNRGGLATLADIIPQLFAAETGFIKYRALNTDFNSAMMGNSTVAVTSKYSPSLQRTSSSKLQTTGMAYLKPVAILNDGRCFSSCDVLSAYMQDWDAGLIIGEDGQTAGGGAAVLEADNPGPWTKYLPVLPFTGKNDHWGLKISFTIPILQIIRQGKNDGALIEDDGVKSDVIIRPSGQDIFPNATESSQFVRIAQELEKYGQKTGKSNLYFMTDVDFQSTAPVNSTLHWKVTSQGIASLTLQHDEDSTPVATLKLEGSRTNPHETQWTIPAHESKPVHRKYMIVGKSSDGRVLLKTIRHVRYTPPRSQFKRLANGEVFKWDFSPSPYAMIYNANKTSAKDGWKKVDNALAVVGDRSSETSPQTSNEFTTASLFFQVKAGQTLEINVQCDYDTELLMDSFLSFGAISNGTTTPFRIGDSTIAVGKGTVSQRFNYTALSDAVELFAQVSIFQLMPKNITISQFDVLIK